MIENRIGQRAVAFELLVGAAFFGGIRWAFNASGWEPLGSMVSGGQVAAVLTTLALLQYFRSSGRSWRELGLFKPPSWWRALLVCIGTVVAVALSATLLLPMLQTIFPDPGTAENATRFHELAGNLPLLLISIPLIAWFGAAFCEEVIFRGFILTRLITLFGKGRAATALAILAHAIVFGLLHWSQGTAGVLLVSIIAMILASGFLMAGRNLWPVVLVHAIPDTITFISIYQGA